MSVTTRSGRRRQGDWRPARRRGAVVVVVDELERPAGAHDDVVRCRRRRSGTQDVGGAHVAAVLRQHADMVEAGKSRSRWCRPGSSASTTTSVHCARSVGPMPSVRHRPLDVERRCPTSPLAGAVTLVTRRSAYGIGITSKRRGAAATLFASEPFSNTTWRWSARTRACSGRRRPPAGRSSRCACRHRRPRIAPACVELGEHRLAAVRARGDDGVGPVVGEPGAGADVGDRPADRHAARVGDRLRRRGDVDTARSAYGASVTDRPAAAVLFLSAPNSMTWLASSARTMMYCGPERSTGTTVSRWPASEAPAASRPGAGDAAKQRVAAVEGRVARDVDAVDPGAERRASADIRARPVDGQRIAGGHRGEQRREPGDGQVGDG